MSWLDGLANALLTARDEALRKQRETEEQERYNFQKWLQEEANKRESELHPHAVKYAALVNEGAETDNLFNQGKLNLFNDTYNDQVDQTKETTRGMKIKNDLGQQQYNYLEASNPFQLRITGANANEAESRARVAQGTEAYNIDNAKWTTFGNMYGALGSQLDYLFNKEANPLRLGSLNSQSIIDKTNANIAQATEKDKIEISGNEKEISDVNVEYAPKTAAENLKALGLDNYIKSLNAQELELMLKFLPEKAQAEIRSILAGTEATKANTAAINANTKAASSPGSKSSGSSSSNTRLSEKEINDTYLKYYNSAVSSYDTDYNNWYQRNTKTVNGIRMTTGTYPGYKYNGKTYTSREALGNAVAMDQLRMLGIIPEGKSGGTATSGVSNKTTNAVAKPNTSGTAKTTKSGAYVPSTPPPKGVDVTLWNAVDQKIASKKSFTEALREYSKENPTGWNNPNDPIYKIFKKRAEIKKLNFSAIVESIKPGGKKK
jgi:hypothetical protein